MLYFVFARKFNFTPAQVDEMPSTTVMAFVEILRVLADKEKGITEDDLVKEMN